MTKSIRHNEEELKTSSLTEVRVEKTLDNIHELYAAVEENPSSKLAELTADVAYAIEEADLTARQVEVIQLYYYECLTQEEVAKAVSTSRPEVTRKLDRAVKKIAQVFEDWKYWEESEHDE